MVIVGYLTSFYVPDLSTIYFKGKMSKTRCFLLVSNNNISNSAPPYNFTHHRTLPAELMSKVVFALKTSAYRTEFENLFLFLPSILWLEALNLEVRRIIGLAMFLLTLFIRICTFDSIDGFFFFSHIPHPSFPYFVQCVPCGYH